MSWRNHAVDSCNGFDSWKWFDSCAWFDTRNCFDDQKDWFDEHVIGRTFRTRRLLRMIRVTREISMGCTTTDVKGVINVISHDMQDKTPSSNDSYDTTGAMTRLVL